MPQVFDKICLKVTRDTSCPICGPQSGERQGNSIFWWGIFGKICAFYQNSRIIAPDTQYTLPPNYSSSKGLIYISLWNWALQKMLGFATFYHIFILLENKLSFMHLKWHLYLKVFLTWLVLSEWVFCCYFVGYGGIITNTNKKTEYCSKINKENELDHGKMFSLLSCL